jgi:hypothetical protein
MEAGRGAVSVGDAANTGIEPMETKIPSASIAIELAVAVSFADIVCKLSNRRSKLEGEKR